MKSPSLKTHEKNARMIIEEIIETARFAPSVHNSQPWEFEIIENSIIIHRSKKRVLASGDPIGRETWISIGCVLEAIVLTAKAYGIKTREPIIIKESISLEFSNLHRVNVDSRNNNILKLIKSRYSDRSRYEKRFLKDREIERILSFKSYDSTTLNLVLNHEEISSISSLVKKGVKVALSSPDFRNELTEYVIPPLVMKKTGIPTKSLRIKPFIGLIELMLIKFGLNISKRANDEYKRWSNSPAIVCISAAGDSKIHWINAGRTYYKSLILITDLGLSNSTSAAPVEAFDFHADIEQILGSNYRLQALYRVGYSNARPAPAPRLSTEELLLN